MASSRRRSLTAGSAGPNPPGNHFPGDLAWPGKGCASWFPDWASGRQTYPASFTLSDEPSD